MTTRARRNEVSLKDKVKLIKASSSSSQRQLADRFNVGRSQVNRILKRKAEFMGAYEDNECLDRKRVCVLSDYDNIDNDNLDDDVPATEELHDGWEEELAQEHDTREEVEDIEEEDSTDHPKPKNLTAALKAAAGLISFCTERGYDKTLQHFFTGQEQLQKIAMEAMCNVKQTTLDSFFSKT